MLTPRNVILLSVAICVFALLWTIYDVTRPPDSGGIGRDSYGTRALGQRGLFETLSELNLPVSRRLAPPDQDLPPGAVYALCGPDPWLVGTEPRHIAQLRTWVEHGGRVVVAPSPEAIDNAMMAEPDFAETINTDVLELLGIEQVSLRRIAAADLPAADTANSGPATDAPESANDDTDWLPPAFDVKKVEVKTIPVATWGSLSNLGPIAELAVPEDDLRTLDCAGPEPAGRVTFKDTDGRARTVVAQFPRANGEIVVVSDPRLFSNVVLAQADNSVLAVDLLAGPGGRVLIDEFYHGLSVRGNPFYLLSRPAYALITLALLLGVGVYTWREAVLLGPPLTTSGPSRRAIGEYLDAMSRLFRRGRGARPFILQEVWRGVLRELQREFRLPPSKPDVEQLAAAIARHDPQRAARFRDAAQAVDAALAKRDNCGLTQTVAAIQGMTSCL